MNWDELKERFNKFFEYLEDYYYGPYRQTLARAARDEEDLFMLILFAESLGIPNPVAFYTLELQPIFLEQFHQWHLRMGLDHSPLEHIGCC